MIKLTSRFIKYPMNAIAIWPFVIFRNKSISTNSRVLNHERIHLEQQKELLVIPFFILYGLQYMFNWLKGDNRYTAYRNVQAEKEAFENERNKEYIKTRERYRWLLN